MTSTGRFSPTQKIELDGVIGQLERREALKRQLDGEQLASLARAMQRVLGQGGSGQEGSGPSASGQSASGLSPGPAPPNDSATLGSGQPLAGGMASRELAYRSLRLEVATALQESEHVAERLMSTAFVVAEQFPTTLERLLAAEISLNHVRVIADEAALIETGNALTDAPRRARYEQEVLEYAREETPNRLRPIARRLAARQSAASLATRHEAARERRCVRVLPLDDGMADLVAHLSAEDAYAIRDRILTLARSAHHAEEQAAAATPDPAQRGHSLAGRRPSRAAKAADVLRDLLLGEGIAGDPATQRVRAHIQVVVPAHGAPELMGYGLIDRDTAARIASGAKVWERVAVDDAGAVLAVDRYRPSAEMTRLLAARDLHCRAPGCRVPVTRCDNDHTVDAALGGATSTANLAHLCRGHHVLKHHSDWEITQEPGGVIRWTSPTGRVYRDRPPSRVRFRRPADAEHTG